MFSEHPSACGYTSLFPSMGMTVAVTVCWAVAHVPSEIRIRADSQGRKTDQIFYRIVVQGGYRIVVQEVTLVGRESSPPGGPQIRPTCLKTRPRGPQPPDIINGSLLGNVRNDTEITPTRWDANQARLVGHKMGPRGRRQNEPAALPSGPGPIITIDVAVDDSLASHACRRDGLAQSEPPMATAQEPTPPRCPPSSSALRHAPFPPPRCWGGTFWKRRPTLLQTVEHGSGAWRNALVVVQPLRPCKETPLAHAAHMMCCSLIRAIRFPHALAEGSLCSRTMCALCGALTQTPLFTAIRFLHRIAQLSSNIRFTCFCWCKWQLFEFTRAFPNQRTRATFNFNSRSFLFVGFGFRSTKATPTSS